MLKTVAEEMSQKKDPQSDWKCSSGWLSHWKERHNVSYRSVCGENASVNQEVCTDWKENVLQPLLEKYSPDNVFNTDETGLYWCLLPDKTHSVVGEKCTGGKSFDEYIVYNEEVQCCPMPTADNILESLTNDKDDNDEDNHGEELPSITYQQAQQAFLTIQAYLLQSSEPPYSLLQKLAGEVTKHHTSTLLQSKITDYFKRQ